MIYVVGLGPGNEDQMTPRALAALEKCDIIIGYKAYIELVRHLFEGRKELVASPMKGETERCRKVLELSKQGSHRRPHIERRPRRLRHGRYHARNCERAKPRSR